MSDSTEFDAIMAQVADLFADAPADLPKLKDNGLSYAGDEGTVSRYAVRVNGTTLFYATVDTDPEFALTGKGLPEGVSAHRIEIRSVDGSQVLSTGGVAAKAPHKDGTHVDGQTVAAYVLPRVKRFLGELNG